MKRSNWVRLIAVILIISMLAAPVSAAPNRGNDGVRTNGAFGIIVDFIRDIIRDIFDDWFDKPGEEEPTPTTPVNPTTPTQPGETEPEETDPTEPGETKPTEPGETDPTEPAEDEEKVETVLNLVEGHSNTENGHLLRGDTYTLSQVVTQQAQQPQVAPYALRSSANVSTYGLNSSAYNVQSVDAGDANQVIISMVVGDVRTFTVDGDQTGNYSNKFVNVNTEAVSEETTNTTAELATHTTGLKNGNYLLVNANQLFRTGGGNRAVVTTPNANNQLTSTSVDPNNISGDVVWTVEVVSTDSNGYVTAKLKTPNGQCLTYADRKVTLAADATVTIIPGTSTSFNSNQTKTWGIWFGGSTYLNYQNPMGTWSFDEGSHWCFYELGEETATSTSTNVTFTAAAAGKTTVTIGGVKYTLHIANAQDAVDASRDIPVSKMTASAGNSHSGEGPERAIDEDESTLWHTNWNGSDRSTHWIQFQLNEHYNVDGLRYKPRNDPPNGVITEYEIQISYDGQTFHTVSTGSWKQDSEWKIAKFDAVNAKYIRLVAKNTGTDSGKLFASAAEIRLTGTPVILVYMPVTMFNYDMDTMNNMTNSMYEEGSTLKSGIHFSNGTPAGKDTVTYATTAHTGEYTNGQYVIQNYLMKDHSQPSWLTCSLEGEKGITATSNQADAAIWTLTRRPGANVFTLTTEIDGTTYYMTMGNETSGVTTEYSEITLVYYTHTNAGIQITKDGYYLGHSEGNLFCGNTNSTSTSNGMGFFPVAEDGTIGDTARNVTTINGAVTSGFSRWNWWSYLEDGNAAQNKFFAELVQHELDENGDIVFNQIEPGIFKTGTGENIADKDVYTNVGLPFELSDKGVYSFDSDSNGVYFADTNGDGSSDPASGTETESYKLTYEPGSPQGWEGMLYGDGSSQLWAPFNTNTNDTGEGQIDYHFGMRADIPFSMTPNGCVNPNNNNSTPITFTFSGDDDVWIFIDGHLVIDLGGIHNRIGATINFADSTITYFLPESNENTSELGCYNDRTRYPVTVDKDGKQTITVKLYNDADGEGPLGKTRTEFASQEHHTMSIFYLERGMGTSNCHIEFNMPMLDTLLVTKDATKSWSAEQDEKDGDGDGTLPLTPAEQEKVDNLRFGFTLYKMDGAYLDDNGDPIEGVAPDFHPVASTNYYVQDKDGNIIGHGTTDANGKFSLQNGQTAKFITDMPRTGVTYYVVEDVTFDGFLTPDYLYAGTAANGFNYNGMGLKKDGSGEVEEQKGHVGDAALMGEHELPMAEPGQFASSYIITVKGSIEANDSLEFICTNYLEHNDKPVVALANEDIIVIDYGLPVQIDPLANDVIRGEHVQSVEIVNVQIGDYDFHVKDDGTIDPAQLQELTDNEHTFEGHSGTFTLSDSRDTFTYKLNKQLTEVEVLTYLIKATAPSSEYDSDLVSSYSQAKLYVVPATIMYYEEDFTDLVKFTNKDGEMTPKVMKNEQYISEYQEPGVVGTIGDSTYGSDEAYLEDSEDSNGTSYFFNTTNGYVRFQYTFTGTGTSFFARTSATTGYMQVLLFNADSEIVAGNQIETYYRDTYFFKDEDDYTKEHDDDPLYNIPVYTNDDLPYGTYTVLVTVAKKGTKAAGPMNPEKNNMKYSMHEFYLDGIRVMQPLNGVFETNAETGENEAIPNDRLEPLTQKALRAYATDGESNLEITTLRRKILEDFTPDYDADNGATEPNWPFAVLTDTNKQIVKASEYESIGPKEEVYLSGVDDILGISNAQTVSFSLKYWQPDGLKVYMGMKAPFGSATVKIGDQSRPLLNATDCYYDVTEYASRITEYEQLCDEIGQPLYTDPSGNLVYESFEDGACYYVDDHTAVPQGTVLDPVDDETKPICYIDTYTFEAVHDIVSLTNIKVVGTYQFTIIEDHEENIDITDPGTEDGEEGGEGNNDIVLEVTE